MENTNYTIQELNKLNDGLLDDLYEEYDEEVNEIISEFETNLV